MAAELGRSRSGTGGVEGGVAAGVFAESEGGAGLLGLGVLGIGPRAPEMGMLGAGKDRRAPGSGGLRWGFVWAGGGFGAGVTED
jgi:hypothetical protein